MSSIDALANILTAPTLLLIVLLGSAAGVILSCIPGMAGAAALSLILPLTFNLGTTEALLVLVSAYTGLQFGGALTAIVVNIPGAPESAVMTLDGYALSRRGGTGRALWCAIFAGALGGLLATVLLVAVAQPLSREALRFGPSDYFALALLGLSALAALASGSPAKATVMMFLGLLLGTVGPDSLTGEARFTFGRPFLAGGIVLIPMLVGLFAISEAIVLLQGKQTGRTPAPLRLIHSFPSLSEFKKIGTFGLLGTAVGTFVGIKPGGGGVIASLLAYRAAKAVSRNKESFGNGAIEGIITPVASDKATVSSALVPLLMLGLPSTPATAVLIGAFTLHNVVPGPLLLKQEPHLVYAIFGGLFIANILVMVVGVLVAPLVGRLGNMDRRKLGAAIIGVSILTAYAAENSLSDVWLAIFFGFVGYWLKRYSFPVAPLLLSFVLGPILESNLRRGLALAGNSPGSFLDHPITIALLAITAVLIAGPALSGLAHRHSGRGNGTEQVSNNAQSTKGN
jgi:putative tricarboxylic transport membrane protein